jgi:hypothetical protein
MSSSPHHALALKPHYATCSEAVQSITARINRPPGGLLALTYILEGDIGRLRLPSSRPPRIANGLWRHTCFEIFIARRDFPAYHEFNLAPSGEWAAYSFSRYREGALVVDEELNPHIAFRITERQMQLDALVDLDCLSPLHAGEHLSLALCAVVEEGDGSFSYWALAHPAERPDFHHRDSFVLEIE